MSTPNKILKYNVKFPAEWNNLQIEMWMIKKGGYWKDEHGEEMLGNGLPYHYEQVRKILWPKLDTHRWHILCRDEILKNKVTVLMGPGSSGKTHSAAWVYLVEYMVFPEETCVLVSSTDIRGLKMRVWGEITMLWQQAREKYPDDIPGHLLDSKIAITTDELDDGDFEERKVRDMRKAIIGIPCVQGGRFVGLSKFHGIKQKRLRLIADEASMMDGSFLSSFANLNKNEDFRAVVLGNPNDPLDPLGRAAEPIDGWTAHMEPTKTSVWETRFMGGRCVNLIGTDSPNFDFPENEPTKYKYLINREKIAETLSFFPKDSVEYYSQCIGSMKVGVLLRRVLTRDTCRQFGAQEKVIWKGTPTTKVYFVDASYGGDRCVGGWGEFGEDINGKIVLSFSEPKVIPILVGSGDDMDAEYQIAKYVKADCEEEGVLARNMFHDATGRGSLGTALSRIWSADTNPVESGGPPSDRPVSLDTFINDPQNGQRRLRLCSEHYDRRVTEFWFSVRFAVEAGLVRNLPEEAMDELCTRKWDYKKNNTYAVEVKDGTPAKPGMKQRTGKSPDMGDWAAGIVEAARQRGFTIPKLANEEKRDDHWQKTLELQDEMDSLIGEKMLTHS